MPKQWISWQSGQCYSLYPLESCNPVREKEIQMTIYKYKGQKYIQSHEGTKISSKNLEYKRKKLLGEFRDYPLPIWIVSISYLLIIVNTVP